jgi:hypothetical protein
MMAVGEKATRRKKMGRPKGSGGPPEKVRRNRVATMLTDAEFAELERLANAKELPLGTMLYELVRRALHRRTE